MAGLHADKAMQAADRGHDDRYCHRDLCRGTIASLLGFPAAIDRCQTNLTVRLWRDASSAVAN